jgi:hypothetical protein
VDLGASICPGVLRPSVPLHASKIRLKGTIIGAFHVGFSLPQMASFLI